MAELIKNFWHYFSLIFGSFTKKQQVIKGMLVRRYPILKTCTLHELEASADGKTLEVIGTQGETSAQDVQMEQVIGSNSETNDESDPQLFHPFRLQQRKSLKRLQLRKTPLQVQKETYTNQTEKPLSADQIESVLGVDEASATTSKKKGKMKHPSFCFRTLKEFGVEQLTAFAFWFDVIFDPPLDCNRYNI